MNKSHIRKIAAVLVIISLWSLTSPQTAFLWSVCIVWILFRLDERILGGIAVVFLAAIPLFLAVGNEVRAEQLAVYVFFLLCMVVFLQIIELIRTRHHDES